jgi:hypothetical protein
VNQQPKGEKLMANDLSAILHSMVDKLLGDKFLGDKLKQRGQSEDDLHRAVETHGDGILEKFADVVSSAAAAPRESFPIAVNYDLALPDAIDAGSYQGVNAALTGQNFPSSKHGQANLEVVLVRYDRRMTSEEVLAELDRAGLRPADLPEFLAFGATYPDIQRRFSVVGLGSVWKDRKGYRNVPCLYTASEGRYVDLHWWDDGWYSYSRFAAIRK